MSNATIIKSLPLDERQQKGYTAMIRQAQYLLETCGNDSQTVYDMPAPEFATQDHEETIVNMLFHLNKIAEMLDELKP